MSPLLAGAAPRICLSALALSIAMLTPQAAFACACGCGVFDVGGASMTPSDSDSGASMWLRYSIIDQNRNWSGASQAPSVNNDDKRVKTQWLTLGGQYLINEAWGVQAELPIAARAFRRTDEDGAIAGVPGAIFTARNRAIGDMTLLGMYTGFSPDKSTGLVFGVKLPTGDFRHGLFDRDTQIGTGSTDLALGGYHLGALTSDGKLGYFVQARFQTAVATQDGYRPGNEFNAAAGLTYNLGGWGVFTKVAPAAQAVFTHRAPDSGVNALPGDTGYSRVSLAPGLDLRIDKAKIYAEVQVPVYQRVRGNQLVAPLLGKLQLGYDF